MKTIFIILLLFLLVGPGNGFAAYSSDVQSEKEIVLLELQIQSRINEAVRLVFSDLNFHTSVSVKLDDQKTSTEKNMENNDLDYLPLVIKDQVNSERNLLKIQRYDIRIVSPESFSKETRNQIKELITGELQGKKISINFIQVGNLGFWYKTKSFLKTIFIDGITLLVGMIFATSFGYFGYQFYIRRKLLTKTHLNKMAYSNVDELVKFVRGEIYKDKNVLKTFVKEEQKEVLGLKSLMPYLKIQFMPEDIFSKSFLLRIEHEQGCLKEGEFNCWLKEFTERLSSRLIKDGNGPMIRKPSDEMIAQFRNIHLDIIEKTIKEINDVSTYAVAFQYLLDDQAKTLSSRFDRPIWSELSSKDLYELNHEHILKNIIGRSSRFMGADAINITDQKVKKTEDMIAQVFASHGKSVKFEAVKPDSLDESLNMFAEKLETGKKPDIVPDDGIDNKKMTNDMIDQLFQQGDKARDTLRVVSFFKHEWTKENLTKLPASYLTNKMQSRSAEEIAVLLYGLPKSTRYFIISHIAQEKVNSIMMILESITDDEKSKKAVEGFLKEVASDCSEGLFQVNEKKAA